MSKVKESYKSLSFGALRMMSQKSNWMMTESCMTEKEVQGDSLVSPSGISVTWKVNLIRRGFFFFFFSFFLKCGFRRQTHRCRVLWNTSRRWESSIKMTLITKNVGMFLQYFLLFFSIFGKKHSGNECWNIRIHSTGLITYSNKNRENWFLFTAVHLFQTETALV